MDRNSPQRTFSTVTPLMHTFALKTLVLYVGIGQKGRECALRNVMLSQPEETKKLLAAAPTHGSPRRFTAACFIAHLISELIY